MTSPIRKREASVDYGFESSPGDASGQWQQFSGRLAEQYKEWVRRLTLTFLRLAKMDSRSFERPNRYEGPFGAKLNRYSMRSNSIGTGAVLTRAETVR